MEKRLLSIIMALALCLSLLPATALAESDPTNYVFDIADGRITIEDGTTMGTVKVTYGNEQTVDNIAPSQDITVTGSYTGSDSWKTDNNLVVKTSTPVTIKASNLQINNAGSQYCYAMALEAGNANVTLILEGTNYFAGGQDKGGIVVNAGSRLTIEGTGSVTAEGGVGNGGAGIGGDGLKDCGTIIINGGTVQATGGQGAAGIGGGTGISGGGAGGIITINGGNITATGSYGAAGIGGGSNGGSGTFTASGNAIIRASSIADTSGQGSWSGVIFEGASGAVYGNPTLTTDLTIAAGETLTIAEGKTLTIADGKTLTVPEGATLTNNGAIYVDGSLTGSGTLSSNVYYPLTINAIGGTGTVTGTTTYKNATYAAVGNTVTVAANVENNEILTACTSTDVSIGSNNSFTMPAKAVTVTATFADALQCTVQTDTPSITYGGTATLTASVLKYDTAAGTYVPLTAEEATTVSYQWYLGTELVGSGTSYITPADLRAGTHSYTCKVTWGDYTAQASADVAVSPKSIEGASVTLGESLTYNGSSQIQTVAKVELGGVDITSSCDVSGNVQTDAGNYTLTVTVKGDSNYTGSVTKDFTIARKSITPPTIDVSGTYTYTGSAITPDFTVKDGSTALTDSDYTAVISDNINAGSGKITVTEKTTGNYTFSAAEQSFTITKAAAPTLDKISVKQKYTVNTQQSKDIGRAGMPADAGDLTYTRGTPSMSDVVSITSWDVDSTGKVTYTMSSTHPNCLATLPVVIISDNYENATVEVNVYLTEKDVPTVNANDITVAYTGSAVPDSAITGTASVDGTWSFKNAAPVKVADSSDNVTVVFTPTDTVNYETVEDIIKVTINKATPTGTPTYTAITSDGKTLADAALGSGTITQAGTITWDDSADTAVTANTAYGWTFTPTDRDNYTTLTGSITPYVVSYSGGGSSSGGSSTPSYPPVVEQPDRGGSVTTFPKDPEKGDTVTITPKPEDGYTVEQILVTDKNGDPVKVTDNGDGTYSFIQPADKVTVEVTFMEDNTMLNFFVDVPANAYYYDAVLWAAENGITGGTSDITFSPDANCTRGQIVTFLWRAAGSPEPESLSRLSDVPADAYYAKAVAWALENGITTGTGNGMFSPDATCTRAQAMAFIYRCKQILSGGMQGAWMFQNPFTDVNLEDYYCEAVMWAVANGITNGTSDTTFSPNADCTRAQIVTFLYRSMK